MWRQAHFSMHLDCDIVNICRNEKYVEQTIKKKKPSTSSVYNITFVAPGVQARGHGL